MTNKKSSIDAKEILDLIPHRYPFLLVDRIEEIVINQSCIGVKNITINEPFFPGHFPGHPIMPGVLIIESMAQTASALVVYGYEGNTNGLSVYLMKVDKAKFRKPVLPGDQLRMEITKEKNNYPIMFHDPLINPEILLNSFPNSKIINCNRDPKDICWSNYKNFFSGTLPFSNNLNDLASFYALYQNYIKFWKELFPNEIYDIVYEELVENPKEEIKNLLNFCDLRFEENCLKHENNPKSIKTASWVQARKPIYKSAIKSSDYFKPYLGELIEKIKN